MNSATPRTDAAMFLTKGIGFNVVSPEFAKQLETELNAAKAELANRDEQHRQNQNIFHVFHEPQPRGN